MGANTIETHKRERASEGVKAFRQHMEAVHRMYAHIHSISMPTITVYPDGHTEFEHTAITKEMLAKCDVLAALVTQSFPWESYGLEKPSVSVIEGNK